MLSIVFYSGFACKDICLHCDSQFGCVGKQQNPIILITIIIMYSTLNLNVDGDIKMLFILQSKNSYTLGSIMWIQKIYAHTHTQNNNYYYQKWMRLLVGELKYKYRIRIATHNTHVI